MKNKGITLVLLALLISGCTSSPKRRSRSSSSESQQSQSSSASSESSDIPSTVTSTPTSGGSSSGGTSAHTGTSTGATSGTSTGTSTTSGTSTTPPVDVIDLGKRKIDFINDYIAAHPLTPAAGKKAVIDFNTKVTFDGMALEKYSLVKTKASFGLDVSTPFKVMFGDETGYITVASKDVSGSLFQKVSTYAGKDTSKYTVTGYLSMYLGHPEIYLDSNTYTFDQDLDVSFDGFAVSKGDITVQQFFEYGKVNEYNCAGHGYGEVYTLRGLTCEFADNADDIFYVTNGTSMIKVISTNRGQLSEGKVYDIVGSLSMKDYAPALRLLNFKEVDQTPVTVDWAHVAQNEPIDELRKVKTSQEDTNTRFESYTMFWSGIYKTTGYLTCCEEGGTNFYVGIRDTYYEGTEYINGKQNAQTTYKMALIDNKNFWNTTLEDIAKYNNYANVIDQDTPTTVYYIPQQLDWKSNETCWKIFLFPSTFPPKP